MKKHFTINLSNNMQIKLGIKSLLIILFTIFLLFPTGAFSQVADSVETVKGKLEIRDQSDEDFVGGKSLFLNNKMISEGITEDVTFADIEEYFPKKNPSVILLSVGDGALTCGQQSVLVDVSGVKPFISKRFGNCGAVQKTKYQNGILTIYFPQGDKPDPGTYYVGRCEIWQYNNRKLRKIK